jgi:asparagine synthase (glutamine-hydrolysing)
MSITPTGVEILANLPVGLRADAPALPPARGVGIAAALEEAVLPALRRPPCLVSFSGGRDSSAVLAVATDVARRHGLDDPIPATMRFPDAAESHESEWQRLVIEHLGLGRVEVVELRDELDALGSVATSVLRRHGLRWPSNGYLHVPLLVRAAGGSLLTGGGGDELFGTRADIGVLILRGRVRPGPRRVLAAAAGELPRPLRERLWMARKSQFHPWWTPAGAKLVNRALAREEVAWPHRWDRSVAHWHRGRAYAGLDDAVKSLGRERDVLVVQPLMEAATLAEVAHVGGAAGFDSRDEAMRETFGHLLPEAVVTRGTKAGFGGPFWGPATRAFAAEWDGAGVDERHVDVAALRSEWLSDRPDFRTSLLLHAAWLHADGAAQGSAASS